MSESIWPVIQEGFQAFGPHYQPKTQVLTEEWGYQQGDWFTSFLVYGLAPEPVTAVALQQHSFVYSSVARVEELLAGATERGFLAELGNGKYAITDKGQEGMEQFFEVAQAAISEQTPVPDADVNRLADLLHRVVMASVTAAQPVDKTNLLISRRTDPGLDAPALPRIDQYLTDLGRFRDDAHIAVWRGQQVSGQAWEAFTYLWRGDAKTLAELGEKLPPRGFTAEGYSEALNDLIQRGWLVAENDQYHLTESGQHLRDKVEAQTDENFGVGLWALDQAEIEELISLLRQLNEGLAVEAEPVPA